MRFAVYVIFGMLLSFGAGAEPPASGSGSKLDPNAIIVTQGAAEISLLDVDAFAETIPKNQRGPVFDDPERIDNILHRLLSTEQLAAEARKLGMDKDPLVQARIDLETTQLLAGLRTDALRKQIEATAPDLSQLAHERYIANPDQYTTPASVDVQHILIATEGRTEPEALALAEKIHAELVADPTTFDAKVEEYSDDASKAKNHGLIHDATSSKLVENFRLAAGKLTDIGDISAPVKTKYGYHILKLVDRTKGRQQTFEEVRDELLKELHDDYVRKKMQVHFDQIRNTKLEANPELVASLRTRYFDDPKASRESTPATSASK